MGTSASQIVDQLHHAFKEYVGGWRNEEALRHIDELLRAFETSVAPLQTEKTTSIKSWANAYFSPRKSEKYGGIEQVRHFILMDLASLSNIASRVEKNK